LLSVVLLGGFRFGIDSTARGAAHTANVDHVLLVQDVLRRTLGHANPRYVPDDPMHPHIDFEGTPDSIGFLAPAPAAIGGASYARYAVSVSRFGGDARLLLKAGLDLATRADPTTVVDEVLLSGVNGVEFSYYGVTGADKSAEWHDRWSGELRLPQLVRVHVRFPDRDTRVWPTLIIALRIAVDTQCIYDPSTKQCQGR
jgi:general secretion pathway protein J